MPAAASINAPAVEISPAAAENMNTPTGSDPHCGRSLLSAIGISRRKLLKAPRFGIGYKFPASGAFCSVRGRENANSWRKT